MWKRVALAVVTVAVLATLYAGSRVQTITGVSTGVPPYQSAEPCRGGTIVWTNWTPCLPTRVPMPASAP